MIGGQTMFYNTKKFLNILGRVFVFVLSPEATYALTGKYDLQYVGIPKQSEQLKQTKQGCYAPGIINWAKRSAWLQTQQATTLFRSYFCNIMENLLRFVVPRIVLRGITSAEQSVDWLWLFNQYSIPDLTCP